MVELSLSDYVEPGIFGACLRDYDVDSRQLSFEVKIKWFILLRIKIDLNGGIAIEFRW